MNRDMFRRAALADLQARGVPFDPEELRSFLAAVWDLVRPGDEPGVWAGAFAQATAHRAPA
jgi:hypothetical protein